jgi:hypothetical protein
MLSLTKLNKIHGLELSHMKMTRVEMGTGFAALLMILASSQAMAGGPLKAGDVLKVDPKKPGASSIQDGSPKTPDEIARQTKEAARLEAERVTPLVPVTPATGTAAKPPAGIPAVKSGTPTTRTHTPNGLSLGKPAATTANPRSNDVAKLTDAEKMKLVADIAEGEALAKVELAKVLDNEKLQDSRKVSMLNANHKEARELYDTHFKGMVEGSKLSAEERARLEVAVVDFLLRIETKLKAKELSAEDVNQQLAEFVTALKPKMDDEKSRKQALTVAESALAFYGSIVRDTKDGTRKLMLSRGTKLLEGLKGDDVALDGLAGYLESFAKKYYAELAAGKKVDEAWNSGLDGMKKWSLHTLKENGGLKNQDELFKTADELVCCLNHGAAKSRKGCSSGAGSYVLAN